MSLLSLAGQISATEAGGREQVATRRLAVDSIPSAPVDRLAAGADLRLTKLPGANRSTIDPNGEPTAGDLPDNRSTIDPNGQPPEGTSADLRGALDPNG